MGVTANEDEAASSRSDDDQTVNKQKQTNEKKTTPYNISSFNRAYVGRNKMCLCVCASV